MENIQKKLSLSDFKKTAKSSANSMALEKISGGVLGACHTYSVVYASYSSGGSVSTYTSTYCN